jgi:AcrR family transcriptional regulator
MTEVPFFPNAEEDDLTKFWLVFGDDPEPSVRSKMIYLTIREVAVIGPGSFNTMGVCDTLGITYPMVNHYFGNRDGLLAEAGAVVYERYINLIWENVKLAKPDPEARLLTWMKAQVALNVEVRGWGTVLNYSPFSQSIFHILEEKFGAHRKKLFELNMARLSTLIDDLRKKRLSNIDFTIDNYPREELIQDTRLMELATTVAWSTLGLSVWRSGGHAPSSGIPELKELAEHLMEAHFQHLIQMVKTS